MSENRVHVLLTGHVKQLQLLLLGGVEILGGDDLPIGHEEVIGAVGAPEPHQTHGASVEVLRDFHHGRQLTVAFASPDDHSETAGIDRCTAIHRVAAHRKALLVLVHNTWKDR